MAKVRVSTTVDEHLLAAARAAHRGSTDASLLEAALEPGPDPVPRACVVNLDSIESVSISSLAERLGRLSDARMRAVCAALAVAVDCGAQPPR